MLFVTSSPMNSFTYIVYDTLSTIECAALWAKMAFSDMPIDKSYHVAMEDAAQQEL